MKFATIGTSRITDQFIDASKQGNALQLEAVYSRSLQKAGEFAEKHQAPQTYNDLEELANDPSIDLVYIASPNSLHFQQAILFLSHQKHVICEKPMFTSVSEWEEAYRVAAKQDVYLFEAMRTIHSPNFKILKESVHRAGTVRSAILHTIQYSSRYDAFLSGELPNIFSSDFAGGALMDLGVYPLTMAISLFGSPKHVNYHPVMLKSGVDGSGTLVLDYEGFVCTILCSKITPSSTPSEIHGELGSISIQKASTIDTITFHDRQSGHAEVISVKENEQNMIYEIDVFAKVIRTKDQAAYEQLKKISYDVLSVLDQARKSSGIVFGN